MIPPTMAPQLLSTNFGRTAVSFAAALASGWLASKLDARFGQGVYFGGLMQAISVSLNAFVPAAYKALGIGLGDFVPGRFAVPQNPVSSIGCGFRPSPGGFRVARHDERSGSGLRTGVLTPTSFFDSGRLVR